MGDTALKLAQIGLEGPYTAGTSVTNIFGGTSVYNGGSPVPATRRIAIEKGMGADFKFTWDAPQEARGTYAGSYQHVLEMIEANGKIPSLIYCDDLVWYGRMALAGNPTVTTLPAAPFTAPNLLLTATTTAATMPALTTQPNAVSDGAAAKILALQLSATTAITTSTNVTVTGTDIYGKTISETFYFTNGVSTNSYTMSTVTPFSSTMYTVNYFKTVTQITTTVQTAGQQLAVGSLNAFLWTFLPDMSVSSLYSATMEFWDGSAAWQIPGCVLEKMGFQMQIGKSMKLDATFLAQKKVQLAASAATTPAGAAANPFATAGSINPAAQTGAHDALQNLKDSIANAMSAYKTSIYADPIGTAPGTTQVAARLVEYKMDVEVGAKLGKAADGTPYPSFVGREFYKVGGEFTMLFNSYQAATSDPAEVVQFLNGASRIVRAVMPGPALPCGTVTSTPGWPTGLSAGSYGLIIDVAGKYEELTEKDVDGRAAFSFKFASEVDLVQLGAQMQMIVASRINPNLF